MEEADKLSLITSVAASYLRRNSVGVDQIGAVISSVTRAVEQAAKDLAAGTAGEIPASATVEEKAAPAVSVRRSIQNDHIVCLEDGAKMKTLKRHLRTAHGLTAQQYREKWNLPKSYPMVAPAYSASRSAMAKELGLGRKMQEARAAKPKRRARSAAAG